MQQPVFSTPSSSSIISGNLEHALHLPQTITTSSTSLDPKSLPSLQVFGRNLYCSRPLPKTSFPKILQLRKTFGAQHGQIVQESEIRGPARDYQAQHVEEVRRQVEEGVLKEGTGTHLLPSPSPMTSCAELRPYLSLQSKSRKKFVSRIFCLE